MIIFASHNQHKLSEVKSILNRNDIKSLKDLNFNDEIDEFGITFEQNALIKAQYISKLYPNDIIISDDSGICIDALDNLPGIYSARFNDDALFNSCNDKVLSLMKNKENRKAKMVCVSCIIIPNLEPIFCQGVLNGYILHEEKGEDGFGYDPIFSINNVESISEMSIDEKNKISHRYLAFVKVKEIMDKYV